MFGTPILVVMGASGAGKTAAVRSLDARARPHVRCSYFDAIGVPSLDVMARQFGGPEGWQADATERWIARLTESTERDVVHVLEGQTRPCFVVDAARGRPASVTMVLLDCSPGVRQARLSQRGQPELATPRMEQWAAYLRGQAGALGLPVINTDALAIQEVVDALENHVEASWAAAQPGR